MHSFYLLISGPLLWLAFIIFIGGSLFRILQLYRLARQKESALFSYISLRYGLRSLIRWLIPFGTTSMRRHGVMTAVAFAFHICLLLVPLLLNAHIVLWDEAWNIHWWALPDPLADIMTLMVISACIFFLVRRLIRPEVRYVTTFSDYLLLVIVAAPFVTGFYCILQWPGYAIVHLAHILSGEIMLVAIPFSRLSHMFLMVFTRGYMGSEFGLVRHAQDW